MEKSAISRLAELFVLLDRERYNPTFVNNTTKFTDEELKEVRNFFINNLKENATEIVDYLITSCNGTMTRKFNIENKLNFLINYLSTSYQQMSMATQGAQPYGLAPNQQTPMQTNQKAQGYKLSPDPQMFMPINQGAQACPPMPNYSTLVAVCNDIKNDVRYGIDDPYNKLTKSKDELRKALCNIQGRVTIARYYVPDYIKESDNIVCLVESNDFQERNKQQEFMCMVNGLVEGTKDYSNEYNCSTVLDFRSHMSLDDNEKLRDVITNCMKHQYSHISVLEVVDVPPYHIGSTRETFERKLKEAFAKTHHMNPSEFVAPQKLYAYKEHLVLSLVTEDIVFEDFDPKHPLQLGRNVLTFATDSEDSRVPEIVPLYPGRVAVIVDRNAFVIEENKK